MPRLPGFLSRWFNTAKANDPPAGDSSRPGEQITGVVCSRGATTDTGRGGDKRLLLFTFDHWRGADGVTRTAPLVVRRVCAASEIDTLAEQIQPCSVLSVRVRWTPHEQGELLEVVNAPIPPDDPLLQRAAQLRVPVTRHDEQFGTLTLQREPGWNRYQARVQWGNDDVWLDTGATDDEEPDPEALDVARGLWADQGGWDARLRDFIVQELLDDLNENCLDDGEAPVSADEVRSRVRLTNVMVFAHGGFTLWYDDDDLFRDHTIEVSGTLSDGPDDILLQG
jgi:hypothetical protein